MSGAGLPIGGAAGEFVSVQSQADREQADLARERRELANDPAGELAELVEIYRGRGLSLETARQVAEQLTLHDALGAHARDDLGLGETLPARPIWAALASAASFTLGALVPILAIRLAPENQIGAATTGAALVALASRGGLSARAGEAAVQRSVLRMLVWEAFAMGITALVGHLAGAVVGQLVLTSRMGRPRPVGGPALDASGKEQGAEQQQQQGRKRLDLHGGEGQGRRQGWC